MLPQILLHGTLGDSFICVLARYFIDSPALHHNLDRIVSTDLILDLCLVDLLIKLTPENFLCRARLLDIILEEDKLLAVERDDVHILVCKPPLVPLADTCINKELVARIFLDELVHRQFWLPLHNFKCSISVHIIESNIKLGKVFLEDEHALDYISLDDRVEFIVRERVLPHVMHE